MNIGVFGGGQLARMLAQAGRKLELDFMFFSPYSDSCAAPFGDHLCAPFDDPLALQRLAEWADVATYEFENIPLASLESVEQRVPLHPSSTVLAVARDRLLEKRRFDFLGIPTPRYAPVETLTELTNAAKDIGLPAILKTRTQGYDGKGQAVLREESDLAEAWERLGKFPCIVESRIAFDREISIIGARDQKGEMVFYPISENHHRDGILRLSINRLNDPFQDRANAKLKKIMEDFNYVGVMALELFQVNDQLMANEFAPRVHNSGHWTIEGASTSQFENHLRAICGFPLGKTTSTESAAMVNLIGSLPDENRIREIPGATSHYYGKAERPGRKLGHITLIGKDGSSDKIEQRLTALLQLADEPELASRNF